MVVKNRAQAQFPACLADPSEDLHCTVPLLIGHSVSRFVYPSGNGHTRFAHLISQDDQGGAGLREQLSNLHCFLITGFVSVGMSQGNRHEAGNQLKSASRQLRRQLAWLCWKITVWSEL